MNEMRENESLKRGFKGWIGLCLGAAALILLVAIVCRKPGRVKDLLTASGPEFLSISFSGQRREMSVTDKATLSYLRTSFQQHTAGAKGGFTYSLPVETGDFWRDVKNTV